MPIDHSAFDTLDRQRLYAIREKLRELIQDTQAMFPPGQGTPENVREFLMQLTRMALDEAYPNNTDTSQTPP